MLNLRMHAAVLLAIFMIAGECHADTLNSKVVKYLEGKIGTRIGGGECVHVATEALRAAGAEFITTDLGADNPVSGDYVWGTFVKEIAIKGGKWSDSSLSAKVLPGDV